MNRERSDRKKMEKTLRLCIKKSAAVRGAPTAPPLDPRVPLRPTSG